MTVICNVNGSNHLEQLFNSRISKDSIMLSWSLRAHLQRIHSRERLLLRGLIVVNEGCPGPYVGPTMRCYEGHRNFLKRRVSELSDQ